MVIIFFLSSYTGDSGYCVTMQCSSYGPYSMYHCNHFSNNVAEGEWEDGGLQSNSTEAPWNNEHGPMTSTLTLKPIL